MKIRQWLLLCGSAVVVGVPACSGGGDDDDDGASGNGELATGQYEVSNTNVVGDTCAVLDGGLDGVVLDITVTGETIDIDGAVGDYDAGAFTTETVESIDFNDDPFGGGAVDCVIDTVVTFDGVTTAENEADVTYTFVVQNLVGPDCDAAAGQLGLEFPCESEADFQITPYVEPPPLAGTLSLIATGGQLTLDGTQAQDSGFTLSGTIDGVGPFTEVSETWVCYAPDPPTFPNYDLIIGGSDYTVVLAISTGSWAAGTVPLTSLEDATFSSATGTADFTSGNLQILGAPMVVDSAFRCALSITNAPFLEAAFAPSPAKRFDPLRSWHPAPLRRQ